MTIQVSNDSAGLRPWNPFSGVKANRFDSLLDAAQHLFFLHGYQQVTMEAIAKESGFAKATVYGYVSDKESAFRAVAERMAQTMYQAFAAELNETRSLPEQISEALIAKHRLTYRWVRQSHHAPELFAAKDRLIGDFFREMDQRMEEQIANRLTVSKDSEPQKTARLLFAACMGVANRMNDFAEVEEGIRRLVTALIQL